MTSPAHTSPTPDASDATPGQGVTFPLAPDGVTSTRTTDTMSERKGSTTKGERPTTPTVKGIVVDAARAADADLASRIESSGTWRVAYLAAIRDITLRTAEHPDDAVPIARAGLASTHERMVLDDGITETPLAQWDVDAAVDAARDTYATRTITGKAPRVETLAIPYRGRDLSGHDLERQLAVWVSRGIIEPSCADAVTRVINHPEWLSLPGHVVAEVGAGAEMGPLEMLCRWGARVLAVDIQRVTDRLVTIAEKGAGTALLPTRSSHPSGETGADIVADPAGVAAWIEQNAGDDAIVFGMHAYADSGMHVRLTLAADVIGQYLQRVRPSTVLGYLATPTDAFVVPQEIVDAARARWSRHGMKGPTKRALRLASRGQLFSEPYPHGSHVAGCLVAQQGPNYAVAKRLQRWRAIVAQADGHRVSFNVAPATLTRSVTKNTVLKAVYGGAHHFGVEVFAPETSRALMAALLVHDVMHDEHTPSAPGQSATRGEPSEVAPRNPEARFSDAAAHGGLWRTAWAPRSALGVAAVLGAPRLLPISRRGR